MALLLKRLCAASTLLMGSAWAAPAVAATIEVIEYQCSRKIDKPAKRPIDIVDCNSFDLPSPVYLWVRLRGDAAALDLLEQGQSIVIRHQWSIDVGPIADSSTERADEDLTAGQIPPEYFKLLRREVAKFGAFDWRTWTTKKNLRTTSYKVNVLNRAANPIPCAQSGCAVTVRISQ
jgi:hypothetical protein